MRFRNKGLLTALTAVAVLVSYRAVSDTADNNVYDTDAFNTSWSGEYYRESTLEETPFESFQAKKIYFMDSPDLDKEVEDLDVDEYGNPIPNPPKPVVRLEDDSEEVFHLRQPPSGVDYLENLGYPGNPTPYASGTPSLTPGKPGKPSVSKPGVPAQKLPAQSLNYYNRGGLQNGNELSPEGKGYIKIFRDRDASIGGRGWGTRNLITLIQKIAVKFQEKFPGRERLQIADMGRKMGGKNTHLSHQNGLEADIVYIRKDKKEQQPFGAYGKNGFAEQFVVRGPVTYQPYKNARGQKRTKKIVSLKVSSNFDTAANFELLLMVDKEAKAKTYFTDRNLIREFFRYAEKQHRSEEPAVRDLLMKMDHAESHCDHFHVRLLCQDGDSQCKSTIAPPLKRSHKKKRKS